MIPLLHPMCICRFRSKWSKFASTPQGAFTEVRSTARACCCLDRLYAYGGTDQNQRVHSSLEAYNPEVRPLKRLGMGHLLWRFVWNIMEYLENLSENSTASRFAIFHHEFSTDFTCQAGSWIFRKSMQVPRLWYHWMRLLLSPSKSAEREVHHVWQSAPFNAFHANPFLPTDPPCVAYCIFFNLAQASLHVPCVPLSKLG